MKTLFTISFVVLNLLFFGQDIDKFQSDLCKSLQEHDVSLIEKYIPNLESVVPDSTELFKTNLIVDFLVNKRFEDIWKYGNQIEVDWFSPKFKKTKKSSGVIIYEGKSEMMIKYNVLQKSSSGSPILFSLEFVIPKNPSDISAVDKKYLKQFYVEL